MKDLYHRTRGQQSRHEAPAQVHLGVFMAASSVDGVVMLATRLTAKINPCWVSGGLPREENP